MIHGRASYDLAGWTSMIDSELDEDDELDRERSWIDGCSNGVLL